MMILDLLCCVNSAIENMAKPFFPRFLAYVICLNYACFIIPALYHQSLFLHICIPRFIELLLEIILLFIFFSKILTLFILQRLQNKLYKLY